MAWDRERISKLSNKELQNLRNNALNLGNSSVVEFCEFELALRVETKGKKSRRSETHASTPLSGPVAGFHFVCANETGVTRNSDGSFWTGTWVVDEKRAVQGLKIGAYVALHRTKTEPSYMQGRMMGWRKSPREKSYGDQEAKTRFGIDFLVNPTTTSYEWNGDGAGEKGYFRDPKNPDKS